ncbi:fatty acid desaturase family protein [Flavobacterium selenitireducens]|uniref:fatty acid desaturase family protein n=1 Tax=Flavobacterium selenitireducens TaxID=2722704 RepID=UPI00168B60C1|nr:fatty acid desaturase [Flavobacterium selenitireducens]MBD3581533.1 fatty acid desaturase [Flavobacterium selenitireducens]
MNQNKRPVFQKPKPDDFYIKLHKEVEETVLKNDYHYKQNIVKAFLFLFGYFALYGCILWLGAQTYWLYFFYVALGFNTILLFINSFHDAAHGALFKSPKNNRAFMYVLELFGTNNWLWHKRHIGLHHPLPNVPDWDIDIKQSDIIRIFPTSPLLSLHKYQHIYMWFIYPLYTLNWLYIRDFKDFFGRKDNYVKQVTKIPESEVYKLFASKIFNLVYMLILPILVLPQAWYIIFGGWIAYHVSASLVAVVALVSTHVDEDAMFPIAPKDGKMPTTWAEHQMIVTKDFSADSVVANFIYGGFTHHVAHHLFPAVAHTYYPKITPIIKKYAREYDLPYTCYPFTHAVRSHFRLLKNCGRPENILRTGEL